MTPVEIVLRRGEGKEREQCHVSPAQRYMLNCTVHCHSVPKILKWGEDIPDGCVSVWDTLKFTHHTHTHTHTHTDTQAHTQQ
jgi:hypothetical protein